ncbi:MAG TPA: hypothetical protein DIU09_00285 [Hyphomonadaceae bacterium]|nr:hypothetical protein AEM38_03360 [Hyphomonadaceae bacterium UKL13-1]HCP63005.1 hypothetical protein [Hyphomonadaceae bacterium]
MSAALFGKYSFSCEDLMRRFLFSGLALMLPTLSACEQSFCVEEHPQPIEQVWQTKDQSFWDQIMEGKLALIRDEKGTGHLKLARKAATACNGKVIPVLEARAYYERQITAAKAGTGDQKQMCQFQIELTRGHKMEDQETYGNILNESGLRLAFVTGSAWPQQGSVMLNVEAAETCDNLGLVVSRLVPGRIVYENEGLRPKIVERINPATVPEGQIVYGPGSRVP